MARRVALRLLLFLLPFILFPGVPLGVAAVAGELVPLRTMAARQLRESLLYGRAYRDDYFAFKLIAAELREPRVLVLGSSRMMQFRAEMFGSDAASFYNAGGAASTMAEALEFVRRLRQTVRPRVIVLGVDQVWLTRAEVFDQEKMRIVESGDAIDLQRSVRTSHRVLEDLLAGKISIRRALSRVDPYDGAPAAGMNAIMTGSGFRGDGSYQYGAYRERWPSVETRLREGYERIQQGVTPMLPAVTIDPAAVAQVRELLRLARSDGTTVIAFSPPYAPSTLNAMRKHGGFGYLEVLATDLPRVFGEFGFHYADWTDPTPLGLSDEDMIDYFHPSEVAVRRIYDATIAADAWRHRLAHAARPSMQGDKQ